LTRLAPESSVVWFKDPEEALVDPVHFLAYVMTYGTVEDLKALEGIVGIDSGRCWKMPHPGFSTRGPGLTGT